MPRYRVPALLAVVLACGLARCGGNPIVSQSNDEGTGGKHNSDASVTNRPDSGRQIIVVNAFDGGECARDAAACTLPDGGPAYVPSCGDGRLNPGEVCDDGNNVSGDGCTANCLQVEANYACPIPGKPCVSTVKCGDKKITGSEQCDDGNDQSGDGCSATCQLESGWACPIVGIACQAAKCGDSLVAGNEQCDDGNDTPGDGCDQNCQIENGYACTTPGKPCVKTVCGNGIVEGTEQCDDGNDDLGDGCTPLCQLEPDCDQGACTSRCGDGIKFANEQCDDGNTKNGDGCSSTCTIEPGYQCSLITSAEPDIIKIPIVIRDFTFAHVDFQLDTSVKPNEPSGDDHVIVAPYLGTATSLYHQDGGTAAVDLDHKPVYLRQSCHPTALPSAANDWTKCTLTTYDADSFEQWYRDVPGTNTPVVETLTLGKIANDAYQFDSAAEEPDGGPSKNSDGFFPIDFLGDQGEACNGDPHNFSFTSEVRYWFEYHAGAPPTLSFSGDDDVFVFVNHQLALDLGGIHGVENGCITVGYDPADGGSDVSPACAALGLDWSHQDVSPVTGLVDGSIYEIAVFQAERNTCGSNYKLTLSNFLAAKSVCKSVCGDGIVTPDEVCDDGTANNTGGYGKCSPDCKSRGPYCGDGIVQTADGEQCDDGVNLSQYGGCAPGCVNGPYCGDGIVQSAAGEQCDDGTNLGAYNGCAKNCVLGPRCGDGIVQLADGEQCDDHNRTSGDGCSANCQLESPH